MILTITGPSGVGKSTLANGLYEYVSSLGLLALPLQSVTTRLPRKGDMFGEYDRVSVSAFKKLVDSGAFLWHVGVHGYQFGTKKVAIEDALAEGLHIAILVIEAVEQLHTYAAGVGTSDVLESLYLHLDDEDELRRRLHERGDTADIEERIVECRTWNDKARRTHAPFYMLDASLPAANVLIQAVECLSL